MLPLREAVGVSRASNSYIGTEREQCLEINGYVVDIEHSLPE